MEPAPTPPVTVAFAPVKGDRPEWAVQKLTELGVDRIVPLVAARSVVRWTGDRAAGPVERLAAGGPGGGHAEPAGVAAGGGGAGRRSRRRPAWPGAALAVAGGDPPSLDRPVVLVGPEGGWDADELGAGLPTVGLGPNVLRTETAAVAAGTLLVALRSGLLAPHG